MHMYLIWHILESFKIEQTRVIISEKKFLTIASANNG